MSPDSKDRPPPAKRKAAKPSTLLYQNIPEEMELSSPEKRALRLFATALTRKITQDRPFVCLLTNDAALRTMNRQFRGLDYATDVLSFPTSGTELGDLAISIERAGEQGNQFGHCRLIEIQILMLHGVLHLIGMDHETDQGKMAEAEIEWRKKFRLPTSLIERSPAMETAP